MEHRGDWNGRRRLVTSSGPDAMGIVRVRGGCAACMVGEMKG